MRGERCKGKKKACLLAERGSVGGLRRQSESWIEQVVRMDMPRSRELERGLIWGVDGHDGTSNMMSVRIEYRNKGCIDERISWSRWMKYGNEKHCIKLRSYLLLVDTCPVDDLYCNMEPSFSPLWRRHYSENSISRIHNTITRELNEYRC